MHPLRALAALALPVAALAPSAAAQITISESDIRDDLDRSTRTTSFSAGDTLSNLAALQALADQTGGNQTWDFSGLTYSQNEAVTSSEPVSPPVPGSDDSHFARANLIVRTELRAGPEAMANELYGYYILDADERTLLGIASVQQKSKYVPGNRQPLPYTFGSSWVSESDLVFEPSPSPSGIRAREENEVVGWGTLVTPAGSAEALMVETLFIYTSTLVIFGDSIVTVDSSRAVAFTTQSGLGAAISLKPDGAARAGSYSATMSSTAAEPAADADEALRLAVGPNPARGPIEVRFELAQPGHAAVRVYDGLGREVAALANGVRPAGVQALVWDASGVPAGLYFVRVQTDGGAASRRVAVAR